MKNGGYEIHGDIILPNDDGGDPDNKVKQTGCNGYPESEKKILPGSIKMLNRGGCTFKEKSETLHNHKVKALIMQNR